jgi:signal transduction histidine kinase
MRLDNKFELTHIYQLLSSIMAGQGEYKLALEYHHQYSESVKTVFDSEKANALTRAKQEFETEQKEKEALLLREKNEEISIYAASLEAANRDLEALSYSVSHDLKGPLAMIKNINAMNIRDENGYQQFIDDTCNQALTSIDNILSFSENMNKKMLSSEYKPEEIFDLIKEKLVALEPAAHKNNQTINLIQSDRTLKARVNKDAIGRVIDNLVRNSIKFTHGEGKITFEVFAENAQWIVIRITDEGIGIPPELHQHLFKKFSTAHRKGLKGEEGTGLGLYITYSIIKLHGGTIEIDANHTKGTSFIIRLPLI